MPDTWIPTLAVSALVMFVLFRRARRLLTRQRFSLLRVGLRLGLIGTVCALLLLVFSLSRGLAPLVGLAAGVVLGLLGAALTRFEVAEDGVYYTPNAYVGFAVLSLLVGRLIYRVTRMRAVAQLTQPVGGDFATTLDSIQGSPWTAIILFTLLGYYLCFYTAVLIRGWILTQRTPDPVAVG